MQHHVFHCDDVHLAIWCLSLSQHMMNKVVFYFKEHLKKTVVIWLSKCYITTDPMTAIILRFFKNVVRDIKKACIVKIPECGKLLIPTSHPRTRQLMNSSGGFVPQMILSFFPFSRQQNHWKNHDINIYFFSSDGTAILDG